MGVVLYSMRKFIAFSGVLATSVLLFAPSVTVLWNPVPDDRVSGYRVYWTPVGGQDGTFTGETTTTNLSITNLAWSTEYRFLVTAFTTNGLESDRSDIVTWVTPEETVTVPLIPVPGALRLTRVVYSTMTRFDAGLNWTCDAHTNLVGFKMRQWHAGETNVVSTTGKTLNRFGLWNGTNYQWAVASVDKFGNERWSPTNSFSHSVTNTGVKPRIQTWTTVMQVP